MTSYALGSPGKLINMLYTTIRCGLQTEINCELTLPKTPLSRISPCYSSSLTSQHAARNAASAPWKTLTVHMYSCTIYVSKDLELNTRAFVAILGHLSWILVGRTKVYQDCGQILRKPHYTVKASVADHPTKITTAGSLLHARNKKRLKQLLSNTLKSAFLYFQNSRLKKVT